MERRFGVHEPHISPWRRSLCGDLTSAFDFTLKDTEPARLPSTDAYEPPDRDRHDSYVPKPPAKPVLPRQEAGSRHTRPLPYAPLVDGAARTSDGRFTLTFSGGKSAGAFFLVTSANRGDGPWTYTTEAGKELSDTWNSAYSGGSYDLTAHGPNGFLRTFKGPNKQAGCEVTARHLAKSGDIELTLTNAADTDRTLTVSNAYGGAERTHTVRPGAEVVTTVRLRKSERWYDLEVTCEADPGWKRRLAGHVETGEPGVSDPATLTG